MTESCTESTTALKDAKGPYVHVDLSFHLKRETKFDYTFDDEASSLGSSVQSGLRNSLHSSFDFTDLNDQDHDDGDNDSFGGEGSSSDSRLPNWREDSDQSGSDWTMAIESVPDGTVTEYFVHKRALVEGSKRSDFFVSLFNLSREKRVEDEGSWVSKVHANAAQLIPDMLDYMYSPHSELNISTDTAVGLRHLSEFFGIRSLAKEAVSFIYNDMSIVNMRIYLLSAAAFDDLQTQKVCAKKCAESIQLIDPYSDLLAEMDPSCLLDILSSQKTDRALYSAHMSKMVAVYCDLHHDAMDATVFEELTSVEYLPIIGADSALELMLLEAALLDDADDEERGLTYLQKRCLETLVPLVHYQVGLDEKERHVVAFRLSRLPKKVLVQLLAGAFCTS